MEKNNKPQANKNMQLLALSSQMTASILGFAILGYFLDDFYQVEEMYFTLGCAMTGVFVGLYLLLKGVKNINN